MAIAVALLALVVSVPPTASADLEPVLTVGVGTALPRVRVDGDKAKWDPGYDVGGAIGIQLGDLVRWDVFDGHFARAGQTNVVDEVAISAASLASSVKVGWFRPGAVAWPYLSAGFGASNIGFEAEGTKETKWGYSWDVGAGLEKPLGDSGAAVGFRYRYRGTQLDFEGYDPVNDTTVGFDGIVSVHSITVELLYTGLPWKGR